MSLDPNIEYQTIQGWGAAAVYPTNLVTIEQAGAIMRDAGMNVVRVTPNAYDYTYTVGGSMTTPVPISANLDENVARFYPGGNDQTDLINWLQANALEPDRITMIGALWSPPHWMKITTGRLMNWNDNGTQRSEYDPIIPWGDYGHNTGGGRVNPDMWTDWARFVLSAVKKYEQETGLPMHAFSFQNEPNVPAIYNSATFAYIANDVNNPSAGFTDGHWELYGDALEALANERALHPEITTKLFGPELSQLGGGASNPYNLPSYNSVRQDLISRGLLDELGAWATHEYTYPADSAAMWDAWYNGSAHTANIISGGSSNVLGWLWPQPGVAGDNKEIWQTETDGEDQTWTKDGAMGFGLKIQNALVYGNVSGYTSWNLTGYSSSDSWGLVDLDDVNNPTNSYKYDAMKQFSRYVSSGAERINAVFENGKASIGGAHELDSYNGLTVSAFNHVEDERLTMVFTNMKTSSESTTIAIPAGLDVSSFQVFVTSGTQKFAQLADLTPSSGEITLTIPASSFVTITGLYGTSTPVAPNAPTDLSGAVVTNRRIDLSWTDNANNETSFFVQRATNSSFTQNLATTTLSSNATSYQDASVAPSTTYFYRIRAYNSAGYSAFSNVVSYTTTAAAPPAAPTGLNGAVVSSSRIDLSWTDNTSNETSFSIDRATNSSFTQNLVSKTVGSNTTSYQDAGLSPSTTYYYRVRASNIDGNSGYTNIINRTTLVGTSIFTANQDIGSFTPAGSYSEDGGTYTVNGAGSDIWNNSDQFQFVYKSLAGDGTIIARVDSVENTDVWAKAGVMFRDTLNAGSIHALMAVTPGSGAAFQYRSSTNGNSNNNNVNGYTAPYWVRITRTGNSFTGYRSSNGATWTQVGSTVALSMGSTVYVGLAVTSHSSGNLATAVFSNVSVNSVAPDADFDRDGDTDGRDFLAWQRGYGTPAPNAAKVDGDADNDLDVDGDDLAVWQDQYGTQAPLVAQSRAIESGDDFAPATLGADNSWFFPPSTNVESSIDPVLAEVAIDQAFVDGGLADPIVAADAKNQDDLFTETRDADADTYDDAFATWDTLELGI
ncbi:MAG: fibronectin type III domain-containing protein [Planctomycetales bacterium]|nr:fibronectin type III domain-containing protein [Planctomycetales bacterium]